MLTEYLVAKEFVACAKELWHQALDHKLESSSVRRRDAVPLFGCTKVQVIDAVEVYILGVPVSRGTQITFSLGTV